MFAPDTDPRTRTTVVVVLVAAVLGISTSAVLVKRMEAGPVAVAAWRCLGAALLLLPATVAEARKISPAEALRLTGAGAALAGHFVVWFASLQHTTVLRSTLLVCTTPVWAAAIDAVWTRTLPRRAWVAGLAVALPGVGLMTTGGSAGDATLLGDGLAVLGAVLAAIYLRLGQSVRQQLGASAAMGAMCAVAAAAVLLTAGATGTQLVGWSWETWALIAGAVLGPQLVGHQGFTYAVRWVPASTVALVVLLEPVGAALLAVIVLGEVPPAMAWVGAALVLLGVGVATRSPAPAPAAT